MSQNPSCPRCFAPIVPSESPGGLCPKCMIAVAMGEDGMIRSAFGSPVLAPPGIDELGPHFPGLEIFALVGRGGAGAVYRAIQKDLGRVVALKVLLLDPADDPAFGERFAREARAMAKLHHPNIASVHDAGRAGPYWFLTMEFVDGANLRQVLRQGELSAVDALDFTRQICAALEYAHSTGVVHRDIKPENVLVDDAGVIKLVDFGLAKLVGANAEAISLTGASQAMGTWRYMAPEQLSRPREVDHRADIFSLGVVLYELLTGEVPQGRYAPLSSRAKVDRRLDDVVDRTLEQDPDLRYQQVSGMGEDLDSIGRGGKLPLHATPSEGSHRDQRPSKTPIDRRALKKAVRREMHHQRGCFAQFFTHTLWAALAFLVIGLGIAIFFGRPSVHPVAIFDPGPVSEVERRRLLEEPLIVAQMLHRLAPIGEANALVERTVHRIAMDYLIAEEGAVTMTRVESPERRWLQIDIAEFGDRTLELEDELLAVIGESEGAEAGAAVARRFADQSPFRFGRAARSFEFERAERAMLRELGGGVYAGEREVRDALPLHVRRRLQHRTLPILKLGADLTPKGHGEFRTAKSLASTKSYSRGFWEVIAVGSSRPLLDGGWKSAYRWEPGRDVAQTLRVHGVMAGLQKNGVDSKMEIPGYPGRPFVVDGKVGSGFTVWTDGAGRGVVVLSSDPGRVPYIGASAPLAPIYLEWIRRAFTE